MISLPLAFATSLLLGMRHATDADHVVAVSTIISRERSMLRSSGIGAMWGLGHTLTILVAGGAIISFKWAVTPRLGLSLEFAVALMLIVLGLLNVAPHTHSPVATSRLKPFFIGVVHGLAGSAGATLLILPLIDEAEWAILYLVVFGVGTIVGMTLMTIAIAGPALLVAHRTATLQRQLRVAAGAISLSFGFYLAWRIGFIHGLFTADPKWTPL
jgi:high-affinity nickel-transport protein